MVGWQDVSVTVTLGKRSFFEGEPIVVLVAVHNRASDSVWVPPLRPTSEDFVLRVTAAEGAAVAERRIYEDRVFSADVRGEALPPDERAYGVVDLLYFWGERGELTPTWYQRHLRAGSYVLEVQLRTSTGESWQTRVEFDARHRSTAEERAYRNLVSLGAVLRDRNLRARYYDQLLAWGDEPRDTVAAGLVPFLLSTGRQVADGRGLSPSPGQAARLERLEDEALTKHRAEPVGAIVAMGVVHRRSHEVLRGLRLALDGSVAGDIVAQALDRRQNGVAP